MYDFFFHSCLSKIMEVMILLRVILEGTSQEGHVGQMLCEMARIEIKGVIIGYYRLPLQITI